MREAAARIQSPGCLFVHWSSLSIAEHAMSTVSPAHILLDERGTAWIDDTNIKVLEVALEKIAHGSTAEEIYGQHCGHLSLAQIHAALAWYYDHQTDFDSEIDRQLEEFDQRRAASLNSPGRQRLRRSGKRP